MEQEELDFNRYTTGKRVEGFKSSKNDKIKEMKISVFKIKEDDNKYFYRYYYMFQNKREYIYMPIFKDK